METPHSLETVFARKAEAEQLLKSLTEARRQAEAILIESSRKDLFKRVTGQSSLDRAIADTNRAIEAYGRVLSEQGGSADRFTPSSFGVPSVL